MFWRLIVMVIAAVAPCLCMSQGCVYSSAVVLQLNKSHTSTQICFNSAVYLHVHHASGCAQTDVLQIMFWCSELGSLSTAAGLPMPSFLRT